ncbi:uncharacterized protein J3D65DRAFT_32168 [Phyllosticta citribraziliensis]|uniref:Zn(2)-C6 fungal-type domain-containing protein n=1 Tax=Phyllosticta citribraziliensis TaxID=989973 RepID=A0ABR1M9Y2_9PEZI
MQRKRTSISCDRCQRRKVKCQDPVPGPCVACSRAGQECKVSREARARPYYQVSQEQFELIVELLRHHEPEVKLDLQWLRNKKQELLPEQSSTTGRASQRLAKPQESAPDPPHRVDLAPEMDVLDGDYANVLVDDSGSYKYCAPHSETGFNLAVAICLAAEPVASGAIHFDQLTGSSNCFEHPSLAPPVPGRPSLSVTHLPSRAVLTSSAQKFFTEVQCVCWFIPEDEFCKRVELSYMAPAQLNPAWFCFLYAMLSLFAPSERTQTDNFPLTSAEYYNLAMAFLPIILHHPDLDGIRGVVTLALALQRQRTMTASYQLVSVAARLCFNLGLHIKGFTAIKDDIYEQMERRRLWWTTYYAEKYISRKYGAPSAIEEARYDMSLADDNLMPHGPYTPAEFPQHAASLELVLGRVHNKMFVSSGPTAKQATEKENIEELLAAIENWKAELPLHLQYNAPSPAIHRRAISLLHTRYWVTKISISRRFLLYQLLHAADIPPEKVGFFDEMSSCCEESTMACLGILDSMGKNSILSDIMNLDTDVLLLVSLVVLLLYHFRRSDVYVDRFRRCLELWDLLKHVEWPAQCLERLLRIARHVGLVQRPDGYLVALGRPQTSNASSSKMPSTRATSSGAALSNPGSDEGVSFLDEMFQQELDPIQNQNIVWNTLSMCDVPTFHSGLSWSWES